MISAGDIINQMMNEAEHSEALASEYLAFGGKTVSVRFNPARAKFQWFIEGKSQSQRNAVRAILGWPV